MICEIGGTLSYLLVFCLLFIFGCRALSCRERKKTVGIWLHSYIYSRHTLTCILITLLRQPVCQSVCVSLSLDPSSPLTGFSTFIRTLFTVCTPSTYNALCFLLSVSVCFMQTCAQCGECVCRCVNMRVVAVILPGVPRSPWSALWLDADTGLSELSLCPDFLQHLALSLTESWHKIIELSLLLFPLSQHLFLPVFFYPYFNLNFHSLYDFNVSSYHLLLFPPLCVNKSIFPLWCSIKITTVKLNVGKVSSCIFCSTWPVCIRPFTAIEKYTLYPFATSLLLKAKQ